MALADESQYPRLKAYVQGVVRAFARDDRILAWDVWNEPGAENAGSYPRVELKEKEKTARVTALLPQAFAWARELKPMQPLTSGVWAVDTSPDGVQISVNCSRFNCASLTSSPFITTRGRSTSSVKSRG